VADIPTFLTGISSSYSITASYAPSGTPTFTGKSDNYLPKWDTNTLTANSNIIDVNGNIGIGNSNPTTAKLVVVGNIVSTSITSSLQGTSSWAISASYCFTSSYYNQLWLNTGSSYPITSSWSITSSYALNGGGTGTTLGTGSTYPITSSWSVNSVNASSASYVGNGSLDKIPKWNSNQQLVNSIIMNTGSFVGIGITAPMYPLHVQVAGNPLSGAFVAVYGSTITTGGKTAQDKYLPIIVDGVDYWLPLYR
jgi:hypothetical protein